MAGTVTVYVRQDDEAPYTVYTESDMESQFDEMLDDVYGVVKIGGYEYDTSRALKEVDPVAYRQGYLEYVDSECSEVLRELEMAWDLWWPGEYGTDGQKLERDRWIAGELGHDVDEDDE